MKAACGERESKARKGIAAAVQAPDGDAYVIEFALH